MNGSESNGGAVSGTADPRPHANNGNNGARSSAPHGSVGNGHGGSGDGARPAAQTSALGAVNPSQPKDQKAHLVTDVPGPKSRALRAREDMHLAPGAQAYAISSGIAVDSAKGSAITDIDGNTFIDFIGGIGVNALGHSHPTFVDAIRTQVERASVAPFTTSARVDLLEGITRRAPAGPNGPLDCVQLYSGGAEAVESALRLAKSATGKYELVSFWGGFHGKTMGSLSMLGNDGKVHLGPMMPGVHHIPYADCYRCPLGKTFPTCDVACVDLGKKHLKVASAGAIAAFVVEPMQGTAGNIIPPPAFMQRVRELANEHDALLIADEMITGLGRTGRWWGVDHSGVKPDIVTIGKAVGGGYPLSGVVTSRALASAKPWSKPSGSSSSYGGNPLASAAGAAAIGILERENLVENARVVGSAILSELSTFVDRYPFVGFVDGSGMFLRIELVSDKGTKAPLSREVTERMFQECVKRGLLTMAYSPSVRLQPALTLDIATANNGLAILRDVFDSFAASGDWRR